MPFRNGKRWTAALLGILGLIILGGYAGSGAADLSGGERRTAVFYVA